ncbi:MAG: DUF2505 domain-containing protein [Propionibacteriaceae bacterium]|nr:DUF2505 domain-containing protein [Propionibacteriaceae bacterium]
MKIPSTLTFTHPGDRVADMFVNPDFALHVGKEVDAENVTTSQIDKGLTSVFTIPSPDSVRKLLGPTMTVTETVTWEAPRPDGSRRGRMTMSVTGMPAKTDGPLTLTPTATGCVVDYDAEFMVRIPLFGKKIEDMAQKYLTQIISACERVGNNWLNSN